jgi:hypothetical protein
MAWARIAMTTIINATKELGWETFINILNKVQRQANYCRADELMKKYKIPNEPARAWGSDALGPRLSFSELPWSLLLRVGHQKC